MPDYVPILIKSAYLVAAVLFIVGLKGMSHPRSAVRANMTGAIGMGIAIVTAIFDAYLHSSAVQFAEMTLYTEEASSASFTYVYIVLGMVVGAVVGAVLATMSTTQNGVQVPTASAFQLTFVLGGAAAVVALVVAAFIPTRPASETHPALRT
jgi:NAD/NADP transhydrogenase beta subunit